MRLFVAVELSDEIREQAARVASQLADAFGPSARRSVSWVAAGNLHLTLRFLGEVDEASSAELRERLSAPLGTPAFRVSVGGLGAFPRTGPPRVIWLGVGEGASELARVHDEVEARLEGLGVEREDRPFRAHLTLGRVRSPLGPAATRALASVPAASVGACRVDHVTLFQSRLSPRGAVYAALARGRLAQ